MFWRSVVQLAGEIGEINSSGPIGISLPTDSRYALAVFACLTARRLSVLLDENYPQERNIEIARRAKVELILGSSKQGGQSVTSDFLFKEVRYSEGPVTQPARVDNSALENDAPAFILTTSGSEGKPKALVHSQRTMLHWVRTLHDAMHVEPEDRVLSVSSPSSLGGFTSLLTFPLSGASSQMFDIKASAFRGLFDCLQSSPVTILRAAPSLLRSLCRYPELAKPSMARLRIVQTYGEPLLKSDIGEFRKVIPPTCLIRTTYGSTEASGLSWFARDDDNYDKARVATGTLMPDTRAAIVDEAGNTCRPNEVGELLIASRYNSPRRVDRWAACSRQIRAGRRRSECSHFSNGDLARVSSDGVFVVLGRRDRMAKVNGQQVELAEVETALRKIRFLTAAEVICQDLNGNARLTAFVVSPGAEPHQLANDVRNELASSLPSFMVPARIILLNAIPLLPGGKVDVGALIRILNTQ